MFTFIRKIIKDNKGQVLPIMAFGIAVFIGFAAITVDYGYLAWQRRELQNAADAGALAAAWELPNGQYSSKAEEYSNKHVDQSFDKATLVNNGRAVKVEVQKEYDRMFGMIFRFFDDSADSSDYITAEAIAEKELSQLDLLPLADIDTYKDQSIKDKDRTYENDPFGMHMLSLDAAGYKKFMEVRMAGGTYEYNYYIDGDEEEQEGSKNLDSEIIFWDGDSSQQISGNLGLLELEAYSEGTNIKQVINYRMKTPIFNETSCSIGTIKVKTGTVSSIETSTETEKEINLSTRLEQQKWRGHVLALLPSKANSLKGASVSLEKGDYLILYVVSFGINVDDDDRPVWGTIDGVWDPNECEFPDMMDDVEDQTIYLIR